MGVIPVPRGYYAATPYLVIREIDRAVEYYREVFSATELFRLTEPNGRVVHADVKIGDSPVMIAAETPEWGNFSPLSPEGGSSGRIHLHVEDADATMARAERAGAKIVIPCGDQFYGQRGGRIEDPFGHVWSIATHKEDLTREEMQARFEAFLKQMEAGNG